MPTTRKAVAVRKSASAPIPGLVQTSLLVPEALHKSMKNLRQIRREIELGDVSLCRLYREAIEYYLNARPQRELLERYRARTAGAQPDRETEELAHADC